MPLAILVLIPQNLGDALFGDAKIERLHTFSDFASLIAIPVGIAINLGGEALYAGIIAAGVSEWIHGRELTDLGQVARSIRYGRLIAVDLILIFGTALGLVFLIVPGVIFYTYFLISPTLVELQEMSVREAMRQSRELVRGSFWRVLLFTLVVLAVTDLVTLVLESPIHGVQGELLFNLVIEALVEPFQGLTTVVLALGLLGLHGWDDRLRGFAERHDRAD
ncbi:MAG: hypothetical protein FJW90_04390 [Actinobacteria bacterium]|nr:hypothetical protein [Actinomycetota bacterium]